MRNLNNYDLNGRQLKVDFADTEKNLSTPATEQRSHRPAAATTAAPAPSMTVCRSLTIYINSLRD